MLGHRQETLGRRQELSGHRQEMFGHRQEMLGHRQEMSGNVRTPRASRRFWLTTRPHLCRCVRHTRAPLTTKRHLFFSEPPSRAHFSHRCLCKPVLRDKMSSSSSPPPVFFVILTISRREDYRHVPSPPCSTFRAVLLRHRSACACSVLRLWVRCHCPTINTPALLNLINFPQFESNQYQTSPVLTWTNYRLLP